eukprot:TRINITY_DN4563_c0_g1_i1.p1 TRINITY_DN4563_c0_g1~~TRINITY_DN4563_c0_g1_i1.p1  ORF type:complete len:960 (+),score=199.31 TRINITY_DN4563_c0_g1_i1:77-2956(+)
MGIPGYFPWLLSCYPRVIRTFPKKPDNVYIDINGLIHECCRQPGGGYSVNEEDSIKRLLEMVTDMIKGMDPQVLMYLSIDGVAPMAKANQQRTRRYLSTGEKTNAFVESLEQKCVPATVGQLVRCPDNEWGRITSVEGDVTVITTCISQKQIKKPTSELTFGYADVCIPGTWDSNAISCGTVFMDKATVALQKMASELSKTSKYTIIIDGVRCPGEGEHKFVDFIKKGRQLYSQGESSKTLYRPNQSHVFVSGDADLLLLGLAVHEPGVVIARQTGLNEYDFVSAKHLRDYLAEHLLGLIGKCRSHKETALIKKAAKLAALAIVASAALTHFKNPNASGSRTAASVAVAGFITYVVYKVLVKRAANRQSLISKKVDIERVINDFVTMSLFVGSDFAPRLPPFSAGDHSMSSIVTVYCKTVADSFSKGPNYYLIRDDCTIDMSFFSLLLKNLSIVENALMFSPKYENWCDTYYNSISVTDKDTKDRMCEEYLKYISWGSGYYLTDSVPSWKWSYPFHYSPTVSTLYEYVEKLSQYRTSYLFEDASKPLLPEQQLVRILPPTSFNLHRDDVLEKILSLGTGPFPECWNVDYADKYGTSLMPPAADELVFPIDNASCDDALEQHNPQGSVVADVTSMKCFGSNTTVAHKLTDGTNAGGDGEIIAVRRPCYIPWRTTGLEHEPLQQSDVSYTMLLQTEDGSKLPHVSRDLPRNFGIPAPRVKQLQPDRATINISVLDAPRVKQFMAEGKTTLTIRNTKVKVSLQKGLSEVYVKVKSTQSINIRSLSTFFKSLGISPGFITIRKEFGVATFPVDAKHADSIKRLNSQNPHIMGTAQLEVSIDLPSKRIQLSPMEYPISQFFSPSGMECNIDWACGQCHARNYGQRNCKRCSSPKDELTSLMVVSKKYGITASGKIDRREFTNQLALFHSRPTEKPEAAIPVADETKSDNSESQSSSPKTPSPLE